MRVVVSRPAADLIREQGGRLYIWPRRGRCCDAVTTLVTASEPPPGKEFRQIDGDEAFELYLPSALARVPDELHLDVLRFRRRVEAFWDGCAWVI